MNAPKTNPPLNESATFAAFEPAHKTGIKTAEVLLVAAVWLIVLARLAAAAAC